MNFFEEYTKYKRRMQGRMERGKISNLFLMATIGTFIGFVVSILVTPKSGVEYRGEIKDVGKKILNKTKIGVDKVAGNPNLQSTINKIKSFINEFETSHKDSKKEVKTPKSKAKTIKKTKAKVKSNKANK